MYSLRKSKNVLKGALNSYNKKKKKLAPETCQQIETLLKQLDSAIINEDRVESDALAHKTEALESIHLRKNLFDYTFELVIALILALAIATVVRQVWFELYEIPSGSMRPTFKEMDRLTVTKPPSASTCP